jgi:Fe-S-cluster containining protein
VYEQRPDVCRRFTMGSGFCRAEREAYSHRFDNWIPSTLV